MPIKNILSAFADEASKVLDEQIAVLKKHDMDKIEIRNLDGKNIADLTLEEAEAAAKKLADNGIKVSSMGSPIGKVSINSPVEDEIVRLKDMIAKAKIFGTDKIRMFSFHDTDESAECEAEVIKRLKMFVEVAQAEGIQLCHENEKGIFGDITSRCLTIAKEVPGIKLILDPANFIQCGVKPYEAWEVLKDYIIYLHIKDAGEDKVVVPAGEGIGHVKEILAEYLAQTEDALISIEPHLNNFFGFSELEGDDKTVIANRYASRFEAFDAAVAATKAIY